MLKFEFTIEETQMLVNGLLELKAKDVISLMNKIQTSAQSQLAPKEPEVVEQKLKKSK
jgi:hypothetical protein